MTEDIRTRKYVPSIFVKSEDNPDPDYSGFIEMKMVDYDLRTVLEDKARALIPKEVIEEASAQIDGSDDKQKAAAEIAYAKTGRHMMRAMVSLLPEVIVKIDITRLEDGFKIDNYEDMRYEGGLHHVLTELASVMLGKQKLTKPKESAKASGKQQAVRTEGRAKRTPTATTSANTSNVSS